METRAVITLKFVDHFGQVCTCNIVESLDETFSKLLSRVSDLEQKGYKRTGDITIQFVVIG